MFSKREKTFSELIFKPYLNGDNVRFEYREWLRYFAISIFWRLAIKGVDDFDKDNPHLGGFVREAISKWSPFLLEETRNPGDFQYDMFILDKIKSVDPDGYVPGMNWFLMRGVDGTIFSNNKLVGIYWRIPGFLFCCHIKPNKSKLWKRTSIKRNGSISSPQYIKDKRFGSFLVERLKIARDMMDNMSDKQRDKIRDSYLNGFSSEHEKLAN